MRLICGQWETRARVYSTSNKVSEIHILGAIQHVQADLRFQTTFHLYKLRATWRRRNTGSVNYAWGHMNSFTQ